MFAGLRHGPMGVPILPPIEKTINKVNTTQFGPTVGMGAVVKHNTLFIHWNVASSSAITSNSILYMTSQTCKLMILLKIVASKFKLPLNNRFAHALVNIKPTCLPINRILQTLNSK